MSPPRTMVIAGAFAWLVALLGAGCASGGGPGSGGWQVVKSKRFITYTSSLRNVEESMRSLEFQYAALASSFFKQDIGAIEVLLLERIDFNGLLGYRREYAAMPRVPGGGNIGKQGLIVMARGQDRNPGVSEALAHLFIHRSIPSAPLWFHEGFAAYSRNAEYRDNGDKRVACFGRPGITRYTTFVPIDRVLRTSWDESDGNEARLWYQNSARMLVDFALHGENRKHAPAVGVMVRGFLAGKESTELIQAAFGTSDLAELSKRVSHHMGDVVNQPPEVRGQCPIPFVIPPHKAPDVGEHEIVPASAADVKAAIAAIEKLPRRDGYPSWFPEEIIARTEAGPAAAN